MNGLVGSGSEYFIPDVLGNDIVGYAPAPDSNEREMDGPIVSGSESLIREEQKNIKVGHGREPEASEAGCVFDDMYNVWKLNPAEKEAFGSQVCIPFLHGISTWTPTSKAKTPICKLSEYERGAFLVRTHKTLRREKNRGSFQAKLWAMAVHLCQ